MPIPALFALVLLALSSHLFDHSQPTKSARPNAAAATAWTDARKSFDEHVHGVRRDLLRLLRQPIEDARRLGDGETRERLEAAAAALKLEGAWPESQPALDLRKRLLEGIRASERPTKGGPASGLSAAAQDVLATLHRLNALAEWRMAADRLELGEGARRVDAAGTPEFALELRFERVGEAGGLRLTVPDPDGGRAQIVLAGPESRSGVLPAAGDLFVLALRGRLVVLVDGVLRMHGKDLLVERLEGGEGGEPSIELRPTHSRAPIVATNVRVKPLTQYPNGFFDDLMKKPAAGANASQHAIADLGLVTGAVYAGSFTDRDRTVDCSITVQESSASSATLLVAGQQLRMILRCSRGNGASWAVDSIDVQVDRTYQRRTLTELKVKGRATERGIELKGTCWVELPNRKGTDSFRISGKRQP